MLKGLLANGKPFYLASRAAAAQRFALWATELPAVKPFYAVKCNPDRQLLGLAAEAGWGFDCAAPGEVTGVTGVTSASAIAFGEVSAVTATATTHPEIIYANPCKSPLAIREVNATSTCAATTFDSEEELDKLAGDCWSSGLILRLRVDDSGSLQPFGSKFGCPPEAVSAIMQRCRRGHVKLAGVSFHVGSHCKGAGSYKGAIDYAHRVIGTYMNIFGGASADPLIVDIGGGFPGQDDGLFRSQAAEIRESMIASIYGRPVRYIAEPGRFLATAPYTLYVPVIAKRRRGAEMQYTVDESLYSSFSGVPFDGLAVEAEYVTAAGTRDAREDAVLYGRTCDSQDIIMRGSIPPLSVGDYIAFRNMGAYTIASSSEFNGFQQTEIIWE